MRDLHGRPPHQPLGQLTLAIGGGVAASTFGGSDADDLFGTAASKGSRIGMTAGASLAIPVAARVAIVPGAHFMQKGAQYQESGVDATFKGSYSTRATRPTT